MDICRTYPKFEADQVLTAEQLNQLFGYLDQQNRWSRKCFIGAGISCGLEASINETERVVTVSAGCGLSTLGYLLKIPELKCTHYSVYRDPVQYTNFLLDDVQIPLWQLLPENTFDSEDPDNLPIDLSFLSDKVTLLYLEVKDIDLDTCTGSDCDEKGTEVTLCVRILLVEESQYKQLLEKQTGNVVESLYQMHWKKYQLAQLDLARLHWLGCDEQLLSLQDIQLSYSYLLSGLVKDMQNALSSAYQTYYPLLKSEFSSDPFSLWSAKLNHPLGIQYFYSYINDLRLAYEEFIATAFNVFTECCIPDEGFPKHLCLGKLYEAKKCRPLSYRHYFIHSIPVVNGAYHIRKVKSLFARLVVMTQAFSLPDLKTTPIKITPSKEKETSLSSRAIPYYYDLDKYPELKVLWNFELSERCLSKLVLNYHDNNALPVCINKTDSVTGRDSNFRKINDRSSKGVRNAYRELETFVAQYIEGVSETTALAKLPLLNTLIDKSAQKRNITRTSQPLDATLLDYPFFRIEGQLGKDYLEAVSEIQQWIKCYNLPVKLLGLKVGDIFEDIEVSQDCQFEDIEMLYLSQKEKISCYLKQTMALVNSIKFDAPADSLEDSSVSKVVGTFVDGISARPLTGVYYAIEKLRLVGETDKSGNMEFSGLAPGSYTLETYLKGYGSKSFPIQVKDGKTLKLGNITLYQEALFDEKEIFFREKTSDKTYTATIEKTMAKSGDMLSDSRIYLKSARDKESAAPISYRYEDLAGGLGQTVKGFSTQEVTEGLAFVAGYAEESAQDSRYEIGTIFKDYDISESTDIYKTAKLYLYRHFANSNVKETDDILSKIYQPLQIVSTLNSLLAELDKELFQFDQSYFTGKYEQLLSQVEKFKDVITGDKYGDLFSQKDKDDIIRYFNLLRQENCFNQFQALMTVYASRIEKIQRMQLLSIYSCHHPGMMHAGGSWSGGTFILVYDDNQRVVLDFALPYICCSDCPPIQLCTGIPVVFQLPQSIFCKSDNRLFKFITNYPGGEVIGSGVTKDVASGDYFFSPIAADVKAGEVSFVYLIKQAKYELKVTVKDPKVNILYNLLEVNTDNQTAKVAFYSDPKEAHSFSWDFGDGTSSTAPSPVKEYDLSEVIAYQVTLKAKQGECMAVASHELTFEICNANFSYSEVSRNLTSITYLFNHPQASKTRSWNLGDGTVMQDVESFTHTYLRKDVDQSIDVTLNISQEACEDSSAQTLTIPALQQVTIYMDRSDLCRNGGLEKVVFDPANGQYEGNGLIVENGEVYFNPAHPDVILGVNPISYTYLDTVVSKTVTVSAIEQSFISEIKLIEGDKLYAEVQFIAPDSLDSFTFETGDGETVKQESFLHNYDISETQIYDVVATFTKGGCTAIQKRTLDLTPCSAEFTYREIKNDGESATIEYTMLEKDAETYQLEDELGIFKTAARIFVRRYSLTSDNREIPVVMRINKPPCIASFNGTVKLPPQIPLSISIEPTIFTQCDKNRYAIKVTSGDPGGEASGPGVRMESDGMFFTPAAANTSGDVTITYAVNSQSTNMLVNIKKPTAAFAVKSIVKVDEATYDVSLLNNSKDFNNNLWVLEPGGSSKDVQPIIRLNGMKPDQVFTVTLTVDWDGQCAHSTTATTFHIPRDENTVNSGVINFDLYFSTLDNLFSQPGFDKVFPVDHAIRNDLMAHLERLSGEMNDASLLKEYQSGKRDPAIAETYNTLFRNSLDQLSTVAIEISVKTAQVGYPLLIVETQLLLDLMSLNSKDIEATGPLSETLSLVGKSYENMQNLGLKLDPDGSLRKTLDSAMAANSSKPEVSAWLKQLDNLVG